LNITDLDPMKYDLLFERFLNPDRISMPDIDVDMQDTRRGEVIDYVTEKYGQERVAQIITFGTMAARNAVRDTGRALGYTYAEVDVIAKLIPPPVQGRHIPLAVSIKKDPDLKKEYDGNPRAKQLIDLAMRLEGTIRSNGVHAAGVVIAPEAIVNYTPIQRAQKGGNATQFDMHWVEELGLLKMDFLGLSNLTVIQNALRIIKRVYGKTIDISQIPLDDVKTYELLSRGDTTGVFQLESAGMKRYLRELKPSVFDDIVAMVALYRPGPMQFIEDFIERKHGRKEVTFEHPGMEAALGTTYGILVYQEQFMQISKDMCGFTGGQADTLRKAIGKKQRDTMAKMKVAFIDGMVEHSGVSRAFADKFWGQLEAFADYCFNKSHSACYGLIAYQTAYLKAHFPAAFMAALMTSDYGNIERIAIEVAECQRMGIEVLPPDVNESFSEFAVILDKNAIRFGLAAIKNVGTGAIDRIVETRGDEPFASVEDFAKRVNAGDVNKKVWESLIKAGAMDGFDQRHILIHNVDLITGYASRAQKNALSGQIDIFGSLGSTENLPALRLDIPATSPDPREFLAWEKELLGLYLSNHPLREFEDFLAAHVSPLSELANMRDGNMITTGGIITTVRRIITKNGGNMAFVGFEDIAGSTELIVFPKSFEETADMWEPDRIVIIKGKVNSKDREGRDVVERKIMVDAVRLLTPELVAQYAGKAPSRRPTPGPMTAPLAHADGDPVIIAVPSMATQEQLMQLKSIFESHKGSQPVILQLEGIQIQRLKLPFNVTYTPDFAAAVSEVLANARVEAAA
jgi:DNA polymerase-3 subunit alpha